jgi:hypothetical protein
MMAVEIAKRPKTLTISEIATAEGATDEHDKRGIESIRRLCQRVGRVLTNEPSIQVVTHFGPYPAPASIMRTVITLAQDVITEMCEGDLTERLKVSIYLLFHELGHWRFDPKWNDKAWSLRMTSMRQAPGGSKKFAAHMAMLNVLNDQRHEIMTAGLYPVARDYFREATLRGMQLMIKLTGGIPAQNYLIYYGRRHILPAPILTKLREAMVLTYDEQRTAKAEALINEYLPLTLTAKDVARMWEIAEEMTGMFTPPQTDDCLGGGQTGAGSDPKAASKASKTVKQQLDKADKGQQDKPQAPQPIDEERDRGALSGDPQDDAGDAEEGEEGNVPQGGKQSALSQPTAEGEAEDGDAKEQTKGGASHGSGSEDQQIDGEHDATEAEDDRTMDQMVDDAKDDASDVLAKEVQPYLEALRHALEDESVKDGDLTSQITAAADRLTRLFEKINVDLDLKEVYGLKSGRLDMRRVVSGFVNESDRIFLKRQEELTDEARMGVYIAVDASGSMSGKFKTAMDGGLAVGRGAEKAGHMVKIVAFDDNYEVVKGWFSKAYHRADIAGHGGGTPFTPMLRRLNAEFDALYLAERIRHSVVFIVTDGQHNEGAEPVRTLMRETKNKHATHIYWIGINTVPVKYKEVERVVAINKVSDLEHAMKGVLRDLALRIRDDVSEGR